MMPNIELLHIDCMTYMATLPDKAFELAIVDPPYNVGLDYNTHNDQMKDYAEWCDLWHSELSRVCNCIILTPGVYNLKYWFNKDPLWQMIWVKTNSCTLSKIKGYMLYEPIIIFGEVKNRIIKDVINIPISTQPEADFHPCPKPLRLWKRLLHDFGFAGCNVFEPFMGSGTGAIAAHQMGFDFVGTEIDLDYYTAAVKRFNEAKKQGSLFGVDSDPSKSYRPEYGKGDTNTKDCQDGLLF